jgi:hypothetical protein
MDDKLPRADIALNLISEHCKIEHAGSRGCTLPPDAKLLAEGWQRRFIADERMAREAIDTYSELGYEVRLEAVNTSGLSEECGGCQSLFKHFCAIYTRKKFV